MHEAADFIASYSKAENFAAAKRHVEYVRRGMMNDQGTVDSILESGFRPLIGKVRAQIKSKSKEAVKDLKEVREILDVGNTTFAVFDSLGLAECQFVADLKDDVAKACHQMLVRDANHYAETPCAEWNFGLVLAIEKELLGFITSIHLRKEVNEGISQLEKNIEALKNLYAAVHKAATMRWAREDSDYWV